MPQSVFLDTMRSTQFTEDELGEFLECCAERDIEPDMNDDDEYIAHDLKTDLMCAYFCTCPAKGPAGGWVLE
jgi:hypothetical protein